MKPSHEGIARLKEGNHRYVTGTADIGDLNVKESLRTLVSGQSPFAVILGCSDSRVPAEIIFDQGLGDLFVIRVAGNIAGPVQVGSIEFAVHVLGVSLVVVVGHTGCGAVQATVSEMETPSGTLSPGLQAIVDAIKPSVAALPASVQAQPLADRLDAAVSSNVRCTIKDLVQQSDIIRQHVEKKALHIAGAVYHLDNGRVTFLE